VDQHGSVVATQLLDGVHGVEQHEIKVDVGVRPVDEADIDLF